MTTVTCLTTDQATSDATAILEAAGLTGKRSPKVSSRIGMQPLGDRELIMTEVTVRKPADYETALLAMFRGFSRAHAYAGDDRRSMRFELFSGRIVGQAEDGGRPRPSPEDSARPAADPIMPLEDVTS